MYGRIRMYEALINKFPKGKIPCEYSINKIMQKSHINNHLRKMTKEELKKLVWRYYMSYWNNRRICTANGGLPPILKEQQYYDSITNKR